MSTTKPIALKKIAFDATKDSTFYFTSSGGNQVVKNKITIRTNIDNNVVYTNTIENYKYEQVVPAGTLGNGIYYNFYFTTYDVDNNASENSNPVPFYCYSDPVIEFTNLPTTNIINSSSFDFNVTYNQTERELLYSYRFILYDSNGNEISNSGDLYDSSNPPISLSYTFKGFEDDKNYKIECNGKTINETPFTTGKRDIYVNYYTPKLFSIIDLTNNCDDGNIEITNNMVLIDGESNPITPTYIDKEKIDLTADGSYVIWNKGYSVNNDFYLQGWIESPKVGTGVNLLVLEGNSSNTITLNLIQEEMGDNVGKYCMELFVNDLVTYYAFSNYVDTINKLTFYLKRVNNLYTIKLEVTA